MSGGMFIVCLMQTERFAQLTKFFLKTFRSSQLFAKATSAPPIRTQKIAVRKKKLVANRKSATGRRLSAAITRE